MSKHRLPDAPLTPSEKAQERKDASIQRQQPAAPETTKGAIEKRLEAMKAEKQKKPSKSPGKATQKEAPIPIAKSAQPRLAEGQAKAAKLPKVTEKETGKTRGGFTKER